MEHHTARLPYHGPYDWAATLAFLAQRAIDGVDQVESGSYRRTIRVDEMIGTLDVAHDAAGTALVATVRGVPLAAAAVERLRHMFDVI